MSKSAIPTNEVTINHYTLKMDRILNCMLYILVGILIVRFTLETVTWIFAYILELSKLGWRMQ